MADSTFPTDSNNFDNDFEKVEPMMQGISDDPTDHLDLVSSTHQPEPEDMYSAGAADRLVDFDTSPVKAPAPSPPKPVAPAAPAAPSAPPAVSVQKTAESWISNIDPRVLDLIYWRDPKKTGIVFGSMLVLLLSLALFSVLSVVAYLSLAGLTVTVSFVIYKKVLQAVQKNGEGHPFKSYLDMDVSLPEDKVHQAADIVVKRSVDTLRELRRLFLVEDLVDSIKFGLLLWVLTYLGAAFNGMTLIILAIVSIFTIPKFYEVNKAQIDQYIDLARTQVKNAFKQIQEKIPLPGKKKTT